jgi:hypothetical protein
MRCGLAMPGYRRVDRAKSLELGKSHVTENLDLPRAALLAARFSGRLRKRSLKRLATKDTDAQATVFIGDAFVELLRQ